MKKFITIFVCLCAWTSFVCAEEMEYTVVNVTANPTASAIHKAMGDAALGSVTALKVNGTINAYDIMALNNKTIALKHLDLTDADIVATANGYEYYTGYTTQDNVLTAYSFRSGNVKLETLKLPNSLVKIADNACYGHSTLKNITFGESLTSIGNSAFSGCSSLVEVRIGDIQNNPVSIGQNAFLGCSSIIELYVGKNVTSVGLMAFYNCTGLNKIVWNAKKVNAFSSNNSNHQFCNDFKFDRTVDSIIIGDDVEEIPSHFIWNKWYSYSSDAVYTCAYGINIIRNLVIGKKVQTFKIDAIYQYVRISKTIYNGNAEDWLNIQFGNQYSNPIHFSHNLYVADTLLTSINVPQEIEKINDYAFDGCTPLTSVRFSSKLTSIGNYSFRNCTNLQEVRLPSSLRKVGTQAFNGCNKVQNVYTYTVEPTSIAQNTFSCWTTAMLNIPYTSRYIYWYNTQWSQFVNSQEFEDDYDYFYANGDVELGGETGTIGGDPDVDLEPGSGLIVGGDDEQSLDSVAIHGDASIISCDNLKANSLTIQLSVKANTWYFFCFPWDILVNQLELRGRCAIREYDGAARAQNGLGGWKELNGNKLHKGRGYIINAEFNDTITIRILHPTFNCENAVTALFSYESENAFDAGWNLIGNPFTSYFDLDMLFQMGFTMPIITWNGFGYDTYRPGDDEYHFSPFEAFFVQAANLASIIFGADGRETYTQSQNGHGNHAPLRAKADEERRIINLALTNGDYTDKTRVVFNPASSDEYEEGVDAAKFISSGAPLQLYTLDKDNQPYSINEQPYTSTEIALGYIASQDGEYTLSATRMDTAVVIYDNELEIEVDLKQGDYKFTTAAGVNNTRFAIRAVAQAPTAVEYIDGEEVNGPVNIYTVQGVLLHKNVMLRDVQLMSGVYLLEGQNGVNKVGVE